MLIAELENQKLTERDAQIEEIAARLGVRAERGRRFAELTSLRVGGAIDWVISPATEEQAAAVVHALDEAAIAWRALGSGSNVLADDADHHYVVVSLKELKGEARFEGQRVSVSAGYSLPRLCIDAGRRGLAGIEGLGGIPGTVGGALWMNAGAYGHEIGTVTETVRVARGGKVVAVPGTEVQWNYRHTSFREGELLLGATLYLSLDDPDKIGARMKEAKNKRLATQPHGARSAGCFFKNPPGSAVGTGKIIDEMGMKASGAAVRLSRPCTPTSLSRTVRTRAQQTHSRWPKRYASASGESVASSWSTKSNCGARRKVRRLASRVWKRNRPVSQTDSRLQAPALRL